MTIRNLGPMLAPTSVALIGASPQPGSVGLKIAQNLLAGGFAGPIGLVNPKHAEILGQRCAPSVADLSEAPDLAVVATPPQAVPAIIAELGRAGTRAAVVITAGMAPYKQQMLDASRPYCLRIMGPNSLGLMLPPIGLNASFAHRIAPKGDLAFVSQSGALVTAVIDWAASRNIGFSHVLSIGDMADADFGDLLDYLAGDTQSRAILLYMEALTNAAKFVSAARRAARAKPVIVVKSGRHEAGAKAALSHTGALAGSDAAYEAAFRRTGLLRVNTLPQLFAAAEMLAHKHRLGGERLMILTNGGGAGVLAADELQDADGTLAVLSPATRASLDAVLPSTWSKSNPADIIGDAGPQRYTAAMDVLLADPGSDALLVMQCPTAMASSEDNARAVIAASERAKVAGMMRKPVITCWLGDGAAAPARRLFDESGIATFETPSDAIAGFMQLVRHTRAQTELTRTPPVEGNGATIDQAGVAKLIGEALAAGRTVLTAAESKDVLRAYAVPAAETLIARDAAQVERHAAMLLGKHASVVVKILSREISHKSDVGGVRLALESAPAARIAAEEMLVRAAKAKPGAHIDGFMVEPMIRRPNAQEIIIGMSEDATFGPVILFGAGGTAVEVMKDSALSLLPLDVLLARQLIQETRISRLLAGFRDHPAADLDALARALVHVSQLIIRNPEIRELDINPLLVDETGVVALDARIRIVDTSASPRRPLAITPYPSEWETALDLPVVGAVDVRPVRPADEHLYDAFFANVSRDDMRLRFFTPRTELSHRFLARLTQIDYAREMAFVAIRRDTGELLGVVRLILDPDLVRGEYAILVRSNLKRHGLGWRLMKHMITYAKARGVGEITGLVLADNGTMLQMARELGFTVRPVEDDPTTLEVVLDVASLDPEALSSH